MLAPYAHRPKTGSDGLKIDVVRRIRNSAAATSNKGIDMKPEIHPSYEAIKATCSCGNVIETKSTLGKDILIDVCSSCHPFYTGKQKILDSGGRVDRFKKRFGSRRV
jgi:large subunit ribosomal protein L31